MAFDFDPQQRTLRTLRLLLRPLELGDAPALQRIYCDPEVTQHYELDTMSTLSQAEEVLHVFLQHHDRFVLIEPASGDIIGTCGLFLWEQQSRMASFGYDLARPYWGHGLMREAAMAVLAYGFAVKDLNRVNALVAVGNTRSRRLLSAMGFREEAILREFSYWKGAFHDMHLFGLLRSDVSSGMPITTERLVA